MDQASPKLSYVKLFAPWQWTVGTGMYIDDIEATIRSRVIWTSVTALMLLIAIGGFAGVVMFRLSNRLNVLSASLDSGAKRNALKRSRFERPFQARQSRLGMAS